MIHDGMMGCWKIGNQDIKRSVGRVPAYQQENCGGAEIATRLSGLAMTRTGDARGME